MRDGIVTSRVTNALGVTMDVLVDVSVIESDEAIELGELLGIERAYSILVNLWAWGLQNERVNGTFKRPNRLIAKTCEWDGDPDELVNALIKTKWLIPQDDGSFYMRGWLKKNGAFFRERENRRIRSARYREKQRAECVTRDEGVTSRVTARHFDRHVTRDKGGTQSQSQSQSQLHLKGTTSPTEWSDEYESGFTEFIAAYRCWNPRARGPNKNSTAGKKLRRMYLDRRNDGYSAADLCDSVRGMVADDWRLKRPSSIGLEFALRPQNIPNFLGTAHGEAPKNKAELQQGSDYKRGETSAEEIEL